LTLICLALLLALLEVLSDPASAQERPKIEIVPNIAHSYGRPKRLGAIGDRGGVFFSSADNSRAGQSCK